jgi:hypothetical protein
LKTKIVSVLAFLAIVAGCATPPKFLDREWKPGRIAVLPFTNDSVDVSIEKFSRELMFETLMKRNFIVLDMAAIDRKLDELGITEAGQLTAVTLEELKDAIPADCFLFGHVIEAKRVMLGVYYEKKFKAEFKIVDKYSLKTVFEDENMDQYSRVVLDPKGLLETAAKEFAVEFTSDLVRKMLNSHPLYEQMEKVIRETVAKIPKN